MNGNQATASATIRPARSGHDGRAIASLVVGAALWGSIWYPYRLLNEHGVGGLWAMLLSEGVATVICVLVFWRHLPALRWSWVLIGIGLPVMLWQESLVNVQAMGWGLISLLLIVVLWRSRRQPATTEALPQQQSA